jgi:hypothetical protein
VEGVAGSAPTAKRGVKSGAPAAAQGDLF